MHGLFSLEGLVMASKSNGYVTMALKNMLPFVFAGAW